MIAFRPRKSMSELELGGGKIVKVADLRFRTLAPPAPGAKLDVAIYGPGPVDDPMKTAVFLLLDSALGEYDVETRLGEIQILDGKQAPADARPFSQLAALVDAKR
jgi:hypothetical protein